MTWGFITIFAASNYWQLLLNHTSCYNLYLLFHNQNQCHRRGNERESTLHLGLFQPGPHAIKWILISHQMKSIFSKLILMREAIIWKLFISVKPWKWWMVPFSVSWKWKSFSNVWLCDLMGCSLPGSSIHGILQARMLEWVALPFSRGSFLTQG